MAVFKNNTIYEIPIMINGSRRVIKPNAVIHGPDSLSMIPGLSMIGQTVQPKIPNEHSTIKPPPQANSIDKILSSIPQTTNLNTIINDELNHLKYYHSLGRNPTVTISILTKDSLDLIKPCCDSILEHVKYPNTTIMIVDTGTTDPLVFDYYKSLQELCNMKNFNYKFVQLKNYHFGKNYNSAIFNHVTTDFVVIQNNDTKALNDYVTQMMEIGIFRKVGSVGCRMYYEDGRIQHDGQHIYDASGKYTNPGHINLGLRKPQLIEKENGIKIVDGNTAAGVLIHVNDYKKINGFDEQYEDIFQDVDIMMKITSVLKKYNICNRKAEIIHKDNASRFRNGMPEERLKQMHKDSSYLRGKVSANAITRNKIVNYDYSIITLVHDFNEYLNFCNSLKTQQGKHSIELIAIPNFNNMYTNVGKAYNNAMDISSGKHVIFLHQDVVVPDNWLNSITKNIKQLEVEQSKWGVIGPAGVTLDHKAYYYLTDASLTPLNPPNKYKNEVLTLDELCLIINKQTGLRFRDERITGFHFYGADICMNAKSKGLHNFAIDAYCYHNSLDGKKNLRSEESYKNYIDDAKRFHIMLRELNINQWRSTTAFGVNERISLYILPPNSNSKEQVYRIIV